jgi:septum formation protein
MKLILGSSSKGRKSVLESLGLLFEVISPDIDEKAIRHSDPKKLTMALAHAKMDALLPRLKEDAIVITSDQVVVYRGVIREKPTTKEEARIFLEGYREAPAETIGAVVAVNTKTGKRLAEHQCDKIYFKPFPDEVIQEHIENGSAFRGAGGFVAEDPALAPFVEKVEGDMSSVMGLSKEIVKRFLKELQ